jgi:hypothetical protein
MSGGLEESSSTPATGACQAPDLYAFDAPLEPTPPPPPAVGKAGDTGIVVAASPAPAVSPSSERKRTSATGAAPPAGKAAAVAARAVPVCLGPLLRLVLCLDMVEHVIKVGKQNSKYLFCSQQAKTML